MKYVDIQEEKVPALGYGTWQMKGEECFKGVSDALAMGYRHIDTAQAYENEKEVGNAIRKSDIPRNQIWLTTKVWLENLSYDKVLKSSDHSLKDLGVDYVDLLLIHWPSNQYALNNTMRAMQKIKKEGKARHIGVSNFPVHIMSEIHEMGENFFCNQVEYHPFLNQDRVLKYARSHDILITAYSPLARGEIFKSDTLKGIAKKYNKNEAQIALRWLLDQEKVAAIPKASNKDHAQSNIDIFDFELTMKEKKKIFDLRGNHRLVDPAWAPQWDKIVPETKVA